MYHPKNGEEVVVKSPEEHEKYAEMGYTHSKNEKCSKHKKESFRNFKESLRSDIAKMARQYPEGERVIDTRNGLSGKVLQVGRDFVIIAFGNITKNVPAQYVRLKESTGDNMSTNESTKEYAKSLEMLANKAKKDQITKKDLETLSKLADLMKNANEEAQIEEKDMGKLEMRKKNLERAIADLSMKLKKSSAYGGKIPEVKKEVDELKAKLRAVKKELGEEKDLEELDSKTYQSYIDKAEKDTIARMGKKKQTDKDNYTMRKRALGMARASLKQYGDKRSVNQRIRNEEVELEEMDLSKQSSKQLLMFYRKYADMKMSPSDANTVKAVRRELIKRGVSIKEEVELDEGKSKAADAIKAMMSKVSGDDKRDMQVLAGKLENWASTGNPSVLADIVDKLVNMDTDPREGALAAIKKGDPAMAKSIMSKLSKKMNESLEEATFMVTIKKGKYGGVDADGKPTMVKASSPKQALDKAAKKVGIDPKLVGTGQYDIKANTKESVDEGWQYDSGWKKKAGDTKDKFGNTIKDKNRAKSLAKQAMKKTAADMKEDKERYQKFFKAAMKKFGINDITDLKGDKKKEFFDYVDKNYEADKESD